MEQPADTKFEIGYVLFIDIVGYSTLRLNEQRNAIETLNHIVRETGEFRTADAPGKLVRLPTGDGMALVFYTTPEAPIECAIEISRALRGRSELKVRMGVHSGPVGNVVDVNERTNIAGAGITSLGASEATMFSKRGSPRSGSHRGWSHGHFIEADNFSEVDLSALQRPRDV
jgi:hypothetical protein